MGKFISFGLNVSYLLMDTVIFPTLFLYTNVPTINQFLNVVFIICCELNVTRLGNIFTVGKNVT